MSKLDTFLDRDSEVRRRTIWVSGGIGIAWGIFAQLSGKLALTQAANQTIIIILASYVVQVYLYMRVMTVVKSCGVQSLFARRRTLAFVLSLILIIVMNTSAVKNVEAAYIERRFHALTETIPMQRQDIRGVETIADYALRHKVGVPEASRRTAKEALRRTAELKPELAASAIAASALLASAGMLQPSPELQIALANKGPHPEFKGTTWMFQPIATNTGPDNYSTIGMGNAPDIAIMQKIETYKQGLLKSGPQFFMAKEMRATLDGYYLRRIIFSNMDLSYYGGSLVLEEVYFVDCRITVHSSKQNAWELLNTIKPGVPVDFRAE